MNNELTLEVFQHLSEETKTRIFVEYVNKKYMTNEVGELGWLSQRVQEVVKGQLMFLKNIYDPQSLKTSAERKLLQIIDEWEVYSGKKVRNYYVEQKQEQEGKEKL